MLWTNQTKTLLEMQIFIQENDSFTHTSQTNQTKPITLNVNTKETDTLHQ